MYGEPGLIYMFLVYGMHWQFNLVTTAREDPKAVLIRAVEPMYNRELMAKRRKLGVGQRELSNGPGKLCQALGLDGRHYGRDLTAGSVYLAEGDKPITKCATRVGVAYAGKWAEKPWRFFDPHSDYVSQKPKP
jgi:DNA-3-methyladenine glycosylase